MRKSTFLILFMLAAAVPSTARAVNFWSENGKFETVVPTGSITVNGSVTASGTVNAATFTIRGTSLITSTFSAAAYPGYVMYVTSGTIVANTSVTISTTNMRVAELGLPLCSELEGVNTAGVSVRVKSIAGLPNSFTVYNADVINNKNYICYVAGKPL